MHSEEVFCGHEVFSFREYLGEDFWDIPNYKHKGSVDNSAVYNKPWLTDSSAPLVIIERDVEDVVDSLVERTGTDYDTTKRVIVTLQESLEEAKQYSDLVVPYEELDDYVEDICKLCIPRVGYDRVKHELFKSFHIEPLDMSTEVFYKEEVFYGRDIRNSSGGGSSSRDSS